MTISVKQIKQARFKETMVMMPLRQYEALMEYLEDLEDAFAVKERANEENIPWEEVKKEIRKKTAKK
jgi:hypothetical protein